MFRHTSGALPLCAMSAPEIVHTTVADNSLTCHLELSRGCHTGTGNHASSYGWLSSSGERSPEQLGNWQGQSTPIIVDLDAGRPGIIERYSYICARSPSGAVFVRRILD